MRAYHQVNEGKNRNRIDFEYSNDSKIIKIFPLGVTPFGILIFVGLFIYFI